MTSAAPFHNLLSFYSTRSPYPDTSTIRLTDSLTGNLALGLDFPAALAIAVGRHLYLRNTSFFSFNIHVPSVPIKETLLEGVEVEEGWRGKGYTAGEMWTLGREGKNGLKGGLDAVGLWTLAADVETGLISGRDVRSFQAGTLLGEMEGRRKGRGQVLPLWRGGPISVAGHSWFVKQFFGVEVYRSDLFKKD